VHLRVSLSVVSALALALGALACSSSSGNGVASKSPAEIVTATKEAADHASSVHVVGSVVNEGQPLTLDMELVDSRGGRGQLAQNGLSFELIEVEGNAYIKGSAAFYRHVGGSAAAQLLQGKWLKAPATSKNFGSFASLTDMRKLLDSTLTTHGSLSKGAPTTLPGGQQAIPITDTTKGGTLYVATSGKPYPLEITKGGSESGKVTFDRWNAPVPLAAPPNAVDITQLQSHH
jgi:hypothetical protein